MSNIAHKVKDMLTGHHAEHDTNNAVDSTTHGSTHGHTKGKEPEFSIQPHPANTNDPADLQPHGGLRNSDNMAAHHAHGPFIPNNDMMKDFPAPMSHEQINARAGELGGHK